ncbi:MAG TPA: TIM barrel protein [Candidatus Hydrogenedentes bacterium]|nr:TIM barrel protein [Candidatus Hydrogenedentota bacterium]HIJ73569.1 TIM barrel protein [Candidatus Hydrogenedentota bacterium]
MLKFSPCIELFWPELDFVGRIEKVAGAGFGAYEFWGWWDKDLDAVERATKDAGLAVAVCCVKTCFMADVPSILSAGGAACFVEAVQDCFAVRDRLGCKRFIVTTGNELDGVARAAQRAACVQALKTAAPMVEDAGITLVLEPLNVLVDHAGYFLSRSAEAFDIVEEVGSPAVKVLFDIYHQQITEGNLTPSICGNIGKIGHFHVANHPGRHEPMLGEINYEHVFKRIATLRYDGYIGLEFAPSDPGRTEEILGGVQALAR